MHAYLIEAHKDDLCFRTLLSLLDHDDNMLFIHMDIKNSSYVHTEIEDLLRNAKVVHVPRRDVLWGGYSQIEVELLLLEEAVKRGPFQFYHLLSGQDLPIKTHEEILSFFDRHAGEEFVAFERDSFAYGDRVLYSHGLWNRFGKSKKDILMLKADRLACCLQRALGIRQNGGVEFQKGATGSASAMVSRATS